MASRDDKKEDGSMKKVILTGIGPALLASLTTLSVTYMKLVSDGKSIPVSFKGFSISKDVQFVLFLALSVFLVFLSLKSIRNAFVSYRDSKQESFELFSFSEGKHRHNFILDADNKSKDFFVFEVGFSNNNSSVYLTRIDGPFCGVAVVGEEDLCLSELVVSKTFLGRYEYVCERCGKKIKSRYNKDTLKCKMERLAFTDIKKDFKKSLLKLQKGKRY